MTMTVFSDLLINMIDNQLNELYNLNQDNRVHIDIIRIAIESAQKTSEGLEVIKTGELNYEK